MTNIAGLPDKGGYKEGVGSIAKFVTPTGLLEINETSIFVADYGNCCFRTINRITRQTSHLYGDCASCDNPFFNSRNNMMKNVKDSSQIFFGYSYSLKLFDIDCKKVSVFSQYSYDGWGYGVSSFAQEEQTGNIYVSYEFHDDDIGYKAYFGSNDYETQCFTVLGHNRNLSCTDIPLDGTLLNDLGVCDFKSMNFISRNTLLLSSFSSFVIFDIVKRTSYSVKLPHPNRSYYRSITIINNSIYGIDKHDGLYKLGKYWYQIYDSIDVV